MEEKSYLTSNDYKKIFNAYMNGLQRNNPNLYKQVSKASSLFDSYLHSKDEKRQKHALYKFQKFCRKQKENKKVRNVFNIDYFENKIEEMEHNFGYSSQARTDLNKIVSKIRYDEEHPADAIRFLFNAYRDQVAKEEREKAEKIRRENEKLEREKSRREAQRESEKQRTIREEAMQAKFEAKILAENDRREEAKREKERLEYLRKHPTIKVETRNKFRTTSTSVSIPNPDNESYTVNEERAKVIDETVSKLASSINMSKKDDVHKLRFALMGNVRDIKVSNGRNVYEGIENYLEIKEGLLNSHDNLALEVKDLMELSSKVVIALYDECLVKADPSGHRQYQGYSKEFSALKLLNDYRVKYEKYYKRFRRANAQTKQEIANVLGNEGQIKSPETLMTEYKNKIIKRLTTQEGSGYYEKNDLDNVNQKDYFDLFVNNNGELNTGYLSRLLKDFTADETLYVFHSFMGSVNNNWVLAHNDTEEEWNSFYKRKEAVIEEFATLYGAKANLEYDEAFAIVSGQKKQETVKSR